MNKDRSAHINKDRPVRKDFFNSETGMSSEDFGWPGTTNSH